MGAGEFMIGTDIGDGAGGWRAAEAVEEAGCCSGTSQSSRLFSRPGGKAAQGTQLTSWAAGSLTWDCEEVASAMMKNGASQGRLPCDIQTSEFLVGMRCLLQG
jgi:hypothetical protein